MLTWAMHLTLLVPGLLWPREILRDTTFDLPLPALSQLLGRGRRAHFTGEEAWLASVFGIAAPLPAASLRLLGDGGDPAPPAWLGLAPGPWRVGDGAIVLDDPARLDLDADEDQALRELVAPLFAHLGDIVAPAPGRWQLRLRQPAAIQTAPLPTAVGRQVDPALPAGDDGGSWRKLLAEAQPMLHAHRVNRQREARGQPTANSLWPWGAGRLPTAAPTGFRTFWGNDAVMKGLCSLEGIVVEPLPPGFTKVRGDVLARHDALLRSPPSDDAAGWRAALACIEEAWLAPALAAVKSGVLRRLTLVACGHARGVQVTIGRGDLWRFWRKPVALADLAP